LGFCGWGFYWDLRIWEDWIGFLGIALTSQGEIPHHSKQCGKVTSQSNHPNPKIAKNPIQSSQILKSKKIPIHKIPKIQVKTVSLPTDR